MSTQTKRIALGAVGIVLLTIAALNGIFATHIGTCTMGSADSLVVGTASLPLAVAAFALLAHARSRVVFALLAPAAAGFAYLAWWSLAFAFDVLVRDQAACDVITGDGPFPRDGREVPLAIAYLVMSAVVVAGAAFIVRRLRSSSGA